MLPAIKGQSLVGEIGEMNVGSDPDKRRSQKTVTIPAPRPKQTFIVEITGRWSPQRGGYPRAAPLGGPVN